MQVRARIFSLGLFSACLFFLSFCHCTVASREQLVAHFSRLHSQDHLAEVVREEVVREVATQIDEVVREEVVKDEQDLHPEEVAREEIVEYDEGVKAVNHTIYVTIV